MSENKNNIPFEVITEDEEPKTAKLPLLKRIPEFFRIGNIDKILKIVAFTVSIAILLVFVLVSVIIVLLDETLMLIAVAVLIIGLLLSLINLFIIYGLGHIIAQNNEILKTFKKKN